MILPQRPGASLVPPHSCHFRLWAPRARRVTLRLVGPVRRDVPMHSEPMGWFTAQVGDVAAEQRYFYRLDDGPDRPDPASRSQPDGVHGPSAVVDPTFTWTDHSWRPPALAEMVQYELHIGTFTPEGTFDAAIRELPRLRDLGINALSLMPVAQFPGPRNWGYDGVYPYAVQNSYGGGAGLKRLIDAAHAQGLAVLLDVVYNHMGPEGNYFRQFGPYFTDQYRTPWGEALNYDGPGSDAVREYVLANALLWQTEFHLDGLRLDAVPFIKDFSARHILAEMSEWTEAVSRQTGRPFLLIGESDMNDPRVIRPRELGGFGLAAHWSDDFHHALHALLTGERCGYYSDFGTLDTLARTYRDAYALAGGYSHYRSRRYGALPDDRPGEQFVIFTQNHDQVGNRVRSDRLAAMTNFETAKLAAALLLTAPYVPMLFMGEEYGEPARFPFFISHGDGGLVDRVRRGRKQGLAEFGFSGEPPDPQDERTFRDSKLRTELATQGQGKVLHDWHRELIALRRSPALARLDRRAMSVETNTAGVLVVHRHAGVWLVFHFGNTEGRVRLRVPPGTWRLRLRSADARWLGPGGEAVAEVGGGDVEWTLPGRSALVYEQRSDGEPRA